jgi:hypothetical protein
MWSSQATAVQLGVKLPCPSSPAIVVMEGTQTEMGARGSELPVSQSHFTGTTVDFHEQETIVILRFRVWTLLLSDLDCMVGVPSAQHPNVRPPQLYMARLCHDLL